MKTVLVTIALGASVIAAPALAQAPGGGGGVMQRDETRAEAQQRADMVFRMLDTNYDGTVTRDEANQALAKFQASRGSGENGGRGGGRLQRMISDAFASGSSLTQQQMEAQALARFDAMDLNHDGTVTAAERQQARAQQDAPAPVPQAKPPIG